MKTLGCAVAVKVNPEAVGTVNVSARALVPGRVTDAVTGKSVPPTFASPVTVSGVAGVVSFPVTVYVAVTVSPWLGACGSTSKDTLMAILCVPSLLRTV